MSSTFECGDNNALVAYLYGECDAEERGEITAHVALCAVCAAELAALESTRVQLAAWTPPEADLGFVITRAAAPPPPPAPWFARPLPAWAQVAAAVVIFGAGLSLGVVGGTARGTAPSAPAAALAATAPGAATPISASDLTALEQRLRREIAQVRTAAAAPPSTSDARALSTVEGQVMARVRALIEESEQRQQRELALRTADIMRDFDSQRSVDLARIQRSFGQMEGVTSAEVREQRQLLNYLMRVSQGQ